MALTLDDEIHIHLNQGHPPSFISEWIYEKMIASDYEWTDSNLKTFSLFLLKAGRPDLILYFFLKFVQDENPKIHPANLLIAIKQSFPAITNELKRIIHSFLDEDPQRWIEASLTKIADSDWPELREFRQKNKEQNHLRLLKVRRELIHKFELFSSQGLVQPAKDTIKKLEKVFPNDSEIAKITMKFKEKDAENVFEKHKFKKSRRLSRPPQDLDVSQAQKGLAAFVKNELKSTEGFESDLAIMFIVLEMDQPALDVFSSTTVIENNIWLYLEVLLMNRRNLEVLNLLPPIEKALANMPDTFLACTFLRSLALWNLGERNTAIEVLQAVVEIKPNYRSSEVLLAEWSRS